jgi:catechol 2,3-dioxygenase-like lactoylglutathione lyase family enzyme
MGLAFDHAVIAVLDLEQAIENYRKLGFNPFYGGVHAGGKTHNALIVFQDGTYLELLAPTNQALLNELDPDDRSSFLFLLTRGEGWAGYALQSTDLEADVSRIEKAGIPITVRPPAGRERADGQQLKWRSAVIGETMSPFLIQDLTPRLLRVPDDPVLTSHPNGAIGLLSLQLAARDLSKAMRFYESILGSDVLFGADDVSNETKTHIVSSAKSSQCPIIILQPTVATSELGKYLDNRGEIPYGLSLRSSSANEVPQELDLTLTHNARISLTLV